MIKEFMGMRKMMSQMMGGGLGPMMGGGGPPGAPAHHGAFNQKQARAGDPLAAKMKPKHRRIRDTKKKKKR